MVHMSKILLIDDDPGLAGPLREYFARFNLDLHAEQHPLEGLDHLRAHGADLIVLDVMLPEMDGFEVCRKIRRDSEVPIIMLTARGQEIDKVLGLKVGADDYVTKPFSFLELMARVEAVLRRSKMGLEEARTISLDEMEIDTENLKGHSGSDEIDFTKREVELLSYLARHPDRPIPREELLLKVWGYARNLDIETRTVDIHIAKLRRKIEADPKEPVNLITVRGAGYRLILKA